MNSALDEHFQVREHRHELIKFMKEVRSRDPARRMVLRYDKLYMVTHNSVSRILIMARSSNLNLVSQGQRRLLLQRPHQPSRETAQQHGRRREQGLPGKPHQQRFAGQIFVKSQNVLNVIGSI